MVKAQTSVDKTQRLHKYSFNNIFRISHRRLAVGGWIFLEPSFAISWLTGNDKSNLPYVV